MILKGWNENWNNLNVIALDCLYTIRLPKWFNLGSWERSILSWSRDIVERGTNRLWSLPNDYLSNDYVKSYILPFWTNFQSRLHIKCVAFPDMMIRLSFNYVTWQNKALNLLPNLDNIKKNSSNQKRKLTSIHPPKVFCCF